MSDKTPLERDIETRELIRIPGMIKLLILILFSGLIVVTFYTFVLKQEIIKKDRKIILMQEKFRNEKTELLGEVKQLRSKMIKNQIPGTNDKQITNNKSQISNK